jgi:expansin (peptidoglycan-binding protein)
MQSKIYFTKHSLCFGMSGSVKNSSETRVLKVHECQKKAQITQERVGYNVFLFDEPPKGSKSLKIFKISLTFRFDKLSNLSKSVHTGENSQILTVSNKKYTYRTVMQISIFQWSSVFLHSNQILRSLMVFF